MFEFYRTRNREVGLTKQSHHPAPGAMALDTVLAALSDPVRLSILCALSDGQERGWGEFCGPVAKSTLSHHMKVLREAGLIVTRHEGTRCYVSRRAEADELFPGLIPTVLSLAHREREARGAAAECPTAAGERP